MTVSIKYNHQFVAKIIFVLVLSISISASAFDDLDLWNFLNNQYGGQMATVRNQLGPARVSGLLRLKLAYDPNPDRDLKVGEVLIALQEQDKVIEHYLAANIENGKPVEPGPINSLAGKTVLLLAERSMRDCSNCTRAEKELHSSGAAKFLGIVNLSDMRNGFSGLPFYSMLKQNWTEPLFRSEVIAFSNRLKQKLINRDQAENGETVFDLALQATNGNEYRATVMLGLTLGRDIGITRYMKYLFNTDRTFAYAIGQAPILVKLVAAIQMQEQRTDIDNFSYPKGVISKVNRSYYFWTSALISLKMRELGFEWDVINKLANRFIRYYRSVRAVQSRLMSDDHLPFVSNDVATKNERYFIDVVRATRLSSHATKFGYNQYPTSAMCIDLFE